MKKRQLRPARSRSFAAVVGATALLAVACGSDGANEASSATGSDSGSVFELAASTVDGSQLDFGTLEGQDTVLWFWAPW